MTLEIWNATPELGKQLLQMQGTVVFAAMMEVLRQQIPARSTALPFGRPDTDYVLAYGMELGALQMIALIESMARPPIVNKEPVAEFLPP